MTYTLLENIYEGDGDNHVAKIAKDLELPQYHNWIAMQNYWHTQAKEQKSHLQRVPKDKVLWQLTLLLVGILENKFGT
jgi:hypothetical protein